MPRLKLNRFKADPLPPDVQAHYVHVYNSRDLHNHPETLPPISSPVLFGNDLPLVFDLGCGRGRFIAQQAAQQPDRNWVGFDWHWKSIWDAVRRVQQAGAGNVRFIRADFRRVLRYVPDGVVVEAFLLFPPVVLEHKRRQKDLIVPSMLADLHRTLAPGAPLHFVTDSDEYFARKKTLLEESGLFNVLTISQGMEGGQTRFQRFWESLGIESKRLEARKRATGPSQGEG